MNKAEKMIDFLFEKIDNLPVIFPKTLEEIENYRRKSNKEVDELVKIIEKDTLLISTLLKISNSPMFGFRSKVETVSRMVNLLGINFTIAISISQTIKETLKTDLMPYCINCDDFMNSSITSSILAKLWLEETNHEFKEDIFLATILQETGKFIISDVVVEREFYKEFKKEIESCEDDIVDIEKKYLKVTTSQVSSEIFKYWKLSDELINMIRFVDDIDNCPAEYKQKAQILDVIKTACQANSLLSEVSVEKALKKALDYEFELEALKNAIEILQERLLD